jgi:hypothetical protein
VGIVSSAVQPEVGQYCAQPTCTGPHPALGRTKNFARPSAVGRAVPICLGACAARVGNLMSGARQKQVDDALMRAFRGQPPSGKVRATCQDSLLVLHHYQHELLRYELPASGAPGVVLHSWHEKPTDKRILEAALAFLASSDTPWPMNDGVAPAVGSKRKRRETKDGDGANEAHRGTEQVTRSTQRFGRFGGVINVAYGSTVEEKGSVFRAIVAYPVATRAAAEAAVVCHLAMLAVVL